MLNSPPAVGVPIRPVFGAPVGFARVTVALPVLVIGTLPMFRVAGVSVMTRPVGAEPCRMTEAVWGVVPTRPLTVRVAVLAPAEVGCRAMTGMQLPAAA